MTHDILVYNGFRLTPARLAWLTKLEVGWRGGRGRSKVGFDCMTKGLTEWDYRHPETGEPMSAEEIRIALGEHWWEQVTHPLGERLTDQGRAALSAARDAGLKVTSS